jgi:hypothetical protein
MKTKAAKGKAARRQGAVTRDLTAKRGATVKGGAQPSGVEPISDGKLRSPRPAVPING